MMQPLMKRINSQKSGDVGQFLRFGGMKLLKQLMMLHRAGLSGRLHKKGAEHRA